MQLTLSKTWVPGNLTASTERSQRAIRWTRGRGGESCVLRLFPWSNRYFADWIRLCPVLSNNSENGNSCPKPHKAARMIEAVGRAVSIETETIIRNMDSIKEKLTALKNIIMETKMDRE